MTVRQAQDAGPKDKQVRRQAPRAAVRLGERRIAEILQSHAGVSPSQIVEAMSQKKNKAETVGEVLVRMDLLNEKDLAEIVATQASLPYISVANYSIQKDLLSEFDSEYLRDKRIMPLDRIGETLVVAFAGVMEEETVARLEEMTGCRLFLYVTKLQEVLDAIEHDSADRE